MKIVKIGSIVKCMGIKFSCNRGLFYQSFLVQNVNAINGWKSHAYCKYMVATASHKLGVFW